MQRGEQTTGLVILWSGRIMGLVESTSTTASTRGVVAVRGRVLSVLRHEMLGLAWLALRVRRYRSNSGDSVCDWCGDGDLLLELQPCPLAGLVLCE